MWSSPQAECPHSTVAGYALPFGVAVMCIWKEVSEPHGGLWNMGGSSQNFSKNGFKYLTTEAACSDKRMGFRIRQICVKSIVSITFMLSKIGNYYLMWLL